MKRAGAVFCVLLIGLTAAPTLGVAAGQAANETATPAESPGSVRAETGPFDRPQLTGNGVHDADAPDSVRMVGDPVSGSVAIRHIPVSPLESEWKFVSPGQRIKTDRLQIYSNAYGEAAGEYQLVVVQWADTTRQAETANGSQRVPVASDQTVQRIDLELDQGYATTEVELQSTHNQTKEMTMWLERDGDRVEGATWRLKHSSIAAGQSVDVRSQSDLWWYSIRTAIIPGIAGIIAGLALARGVLRTAGRGPGYGLATWVIIGAVVFATALGGLWFEIAEVLANFDILMGLSLGVVAFGGGLRMSPPTEKVAFERQELQDAKALRRADQDDAQMAADGGDADGQEFVEIPSDGYRDELYEDLPILPTVRADDGGRKVPKTGIKPFLARIFAEPARLDLSQLKTRVRVNSGSVAEKVYVSPESDGAIEHTPATLRSRMPVWHRVADRVEEMETAEKALYGALTATAVTLPAIGWHAGKAMAQTPVLGALIGTVALAVEAYGAHNGALDFDPAPRHYVSANASLTVLQNEHADAKALEDYEEIAWQERSRTALEARDVEARRDDSTLKALNEDAVGMGLNIIDDSDDELGVAAEQSDEQASKNGHDEDEEVDIFDGA